MEFIMGIVDDLDELKLENDTSDEEDESDEPVNTYVRELKDIADFNAAVTAPGQVAVLFWANWAQPSKVFKPKFEEMVNLTSLVTVCGFRINGTHQATLLLSNVINDLGGNSVGNEFTEGLIRLGNQESAQPRIKFMASMGKMYPNISFKVTAVYKVTNKTLSDAFNVKKATLQCGHVEAFHGTKSANVKPICTNNVSISKFGQTDQGYFGKGFYFSKYADYTFAYAHNNAARPIKVGEKGTVIMFHVLLGKQFQVQDLKMGTSCEPGYDSHVSPKGCEWILFDSTQCLPVYVFEFIGESALHETIGPWEGK
ncbi:hypothetical protein HK100_002724 [Physocladia obscura]|uniref:PARP catalytic domain-containing protein n=1 Tax=Physocladia obscura TaxID=109957 RepID=A0AAD5SUZ4_9FUNG|nr:hypothetical protein HK100_002724 [Physocladia obscura]